MNNVLQSYPKEEVRNAIQRRIFELSFFEFVKWAVTLIEPNTNFKWGFYHKYICDVLQEETIRIKNKQPKTKNIIINVPFRSSKSLIVSVFYPVWSWTINPQMDFLNLSYSADLSTDHSNKVVALINHPKFQELYNWQFVETQKSKTDFKLKNGGGRISGGFTGSILGKGANVVILDDPNSPKQLSDVERHNTIKAWKDTISSRLNDPDVDIFILIQQRLHTQDLTGYIKETDPDNWKQIVFPAELNKYVKPVHLAAKYKDGLLHPERFSRKVLNNFKITLGSVGYANQLLQQPTSAEGNIVKKDWIKTIPYEVFKSVVKKDYVNWDLYLDTAYTAKQQNDFSAVLLAKKINNILYVRKAFNLKLEFPDLIKKIKEIKELYGTSASKIYIELKASGHDVYNTLKRETRYHIVKLPNPTDDKETRLNAVSPLIESGRLVLIEDTSNDELISQITGYPNVSHDDIMDTVIYALQINLNKNKGLNYKFLN